MELSGIESALLHYLRQRKGVAVTHDELVVNVWKMQPSVQTRTIDQTISKLRRKLKPREEIQTVHRVGYRYKDAE